MENGSYNYDYIIVGSGFGGSVSALRLSEKGYKVLVIEKGKWYQGQDFAKNNWDIKKYLWAPVVKCFGILKMSIFRHATILSGVGVGGGSLVYANTLPIPKTAFFNTGSWSKLANWEEELIPYYRTALKMLGAATNPVLFDGDIALKKIAKDLNIEEKFSPTEVGVYFGEEGVTKPDPYFDGEGPARKGCIFCGQCMTGCPHNAKNTLDKNYLYLAQKHGATILAEKEVFDIRPLDGNSGETGYVVRIKDSTKWRKKITRLTAKGIILSGGVMGTVNLLLKLKNSSLPRLSDKVGHDIRTNSETIVSVSTMDDDVDLSKGVAIGSILDTDENSHLEIVRYGAGSDMWKLLHVPYSVSKKHFSRYKGIFSEFLKTPKHYYKIYIKNSWARKTAVLLFMQTLDSKLIFKRGAFGMMQTSMGVGKPPTPFIPESIELTKQYAKKVNGKSTSFIGEALLGVPSTAHILGGAVMGENANEGVIDKENKVFGYKNMYVVDGSMISANPGVNPSLSITAIAEKAMDNFPNKG